MRKRISDLSLDQLKAEAARAWSAAASQALKAGLKVEGTVPGQRKAKVPRADRLKPSLSSPA